MKDKELRQLLSACRDNQRELEAVGLRLQEENAVYVKKNDITREKIFQLRITLDQVCGD